MTDELELASRATTDPRELRGIAFWSVASGLAAVVPVPLLDEHLVRVTRRRMVQELAERRGLELDAATVVHLSGTGRKSPWGCLLGLIFSATFKVAVKLVRRIFRTILFWLLIKDASDAASKTFHEGFLLRLGLESLESVSALQDPEDPLHAEVRALRARIEQVTREVDTRPMQKMIRTAFRGSLGVLRRAGRVLARAERGRDDAEQAELLASEIESEQGLGAVTSRLGALVSTESEYFADLARRFQEARAAEPASSRTADTDPGGT